MFVRGNAEHLPRLSKLLHAKPYDAPARGKMERVVTNLVALVRGSRPAADHPGA